jgi:hypothetical protein
MRTVVSRSNTANVPEKRLAMFLEIRLIGIQHAIEPREQFMCAMVGVQDHRDAVDGGNLADVVCASNCAGDTSRLVLVVDALP